MPKPGNRAANRLVMRFVTAKLKPATHLVRNLIRRTGASRIARSNMTAVMIIGEGGAPGWGHPSAPDCRLPTVPVAATIVSSVYPSIDHTLHMRIPVQN